MAQNPNTLIDKRLAEIETEIARLAAEADELRVARRVNERLFGVCTSFTNGHDHSKDKPRRSGTIGERIGDLIDRSGPKTTSEIFEALRLDTPNISPATVSGTLQRERQNGRLENKDRKWHTKLASDVFTSEATSIP